MDFRREINISLSTKDASHRKIFNLDTSTDFLLWAKFLCSHSLCWSETVCDSTAERLLQKRGHYLHYIESVIKVFLVKLTEKRPILSCRSSTSFTSTHVFLFVGVCHTPASMPRPGRQGRTLLANCRQSGHVNSPLSTEKPWRTWSFWGGMKDDWIE